MILSALVFIAIECEENRNLVRNAFNKVEGFTAFEDINLWRDGYKKTIMDHLDKLPKEIKDNLIAKADKYNKKEWVSKLVCDSNL